MSARENITLRVEKILKNMSNPGVGTVSRNFFDFEKLAITQFPAILILPTTETREDISMSERQGTMTINLRCFVRGESIDTLCNDIVRNIEETIETERALDNTASADGTHVVEAEVVEIQVIERNPPIGEVTVVLEVTYIYKRGNA